MINYSRRRYVVLTAAATGVLAGCSSGGGDGGGGSSTTDDEEGGSTATSPPDTDGGTPTPPASDADPRGLLPAPPEGWEQGELVEQTEDSLESVGAEAGYGAYYTDSDGGEYYVEVLRWPSAEDADAGWEETYSESRSWVVYASRAEFSFAGNGPDESDVESAVVTLIGNSPALTESDVEGDNRAE